ncbi:MAG TPA: SagB/ThcOx family dehydrogenase [Blastocatellia bacterium]|jgi:SagB-type dehydrogenase family enzyme|nr:SagB/ThcOx family dehydrogenase [Blastocatellia bacterium]
MIGNHETAAGWAYHEGTKHSFQSVRKNAHFLDWPNKPQPFKIYTTLDPIELPREVPPLDMPALEAISRQSAETTVDVIPDLQDLAQILYYSAGITKIKKHPGGEIMFRAAPCTGALYEIELYLVCGDLMAPEADLEAGVYHFSPHDFSLRCLRRGDYRGVVARATAQEPSVTRAAVTIICTGTYWRNAWKYQARTYRHFGWDNGAMLANLLATATALGLPARVVMGFVDEEVNRLLGIDTDREVAFSMVSLGRTSQPAPEPPAEIGRLALETEPLSPREVDYPAMRGMHAASSLLDEDDVRRWRGSLPERKTTAPQGRLIPLKTFGDDKVSREGIGTVILKRGSTRRFDRDSSLSFEQFSTLLYYSMGEIPADFLDTGSPHLNQLYLIVHAVDGLQPGAYALDRDRRRIELIKAGEFRREAGYLGLEQALPAEAAATIFFIADLDAVFERFGNRGYRAAQLESGIIGGKIYLAAYAQGFGASGLTFYDDDVIEFFSPRAQGESAIFQVAIGKPAKRRMEVY